MIPGAMRRAPGITFLANARPLSWHNQAKRSRLRRRAVVLGGIAACGRVRVA
jgi:hypothetical protein